MSKELGTAKQDFKKDLKHLYNPSAREVTVVEVPDMIFLMLDGRGDPNTAQEYKDAIEALYSVAYTIKFLLKKEVTLDYAVMPLEGLWWAGAEGSRNVSRENWQWTMMIMQPNVVNDEWFTTALTQVKRKKSLPILDKMRLESLHEGTAVQIMHVGPFATEGQTIERIEQFIVEHHYLAQGKHHEIYLSDPRKTAPEKMHTILRQPIKHSLVEG